MIYVYTESNDRKLKKVSFEAVSYAKAIANMMQEQVCAIAINTDNVESLAQFGADKIISIENEALQQFSTNTYANVLSEVAQDSIVVFPHTNDASSVASFVALQKNAALLTNVTEVPSSVSPFTVKRKAFSGKGIMTVSTTNPSMCITVLQNAFGLKENPAAGTIENISVSVLPANVIVQSTEKSSGKLDLKEAEIVVSAGRGMKAPENWGMIEEMANILGAATACSKPVADIGWRPHGEHVGQTGKAIAPNLYIAVGISGAIQHLAGVNGSKTIVVINSDPEAPFFKSADYGIVGDAFEIVPKFNEALKTYKG